MRYPFLILAVVLAFATTAHGQCSGPNCNRLGFGFGNGGANGCGVLVDGVVDGEVTGVETDGEGRLAGVRLADGSTVPVRALATGGTLTARAGFLAGLGLETVPVEVGGTVIGSRLDTDATGLTLEVNIDPPNDRSLRFHAKQGFVEVGRQMSHGIEVSLMRRPVSPPPTTD